jgi:hypothetical protein
MTEQRNIHGLANPFWPACPVVQALCHEEIRRFAGFFDLKRKASGKLCRDEPAFPCDLNQSLTTSA